MNTRLAFLFAALAVFLGRVPLASAQGTAFSYQGFLPIRERRPTGFTIYDSFLGQLLALERFRFRQLALAAERSDQMVKRHDHLESDVPVAYCKFPGLTARQVPPQRAAMTSAELGHMAECVSHV